MSPCHLVVMEAIDQYSPSPSQQACQGMFPAGTLVRPVVLTVAAAAT